jgi:hypothetical protein
LLSLTISRKHMLLFWALTSLSVLGKEAFTLPPIALPTPLGGFLVFWISLAYFVVLFTNFVTLTIFLTKTAGADHCVSPLACFLHGASRWEVSHSSCVWDKGDRRSLVMPVIKLWLPEPLSVSQRKSSM